MRPFLAAMMPLLTACSSDVGTTGSSSANSGGAATGGEPSKIGGAGSNIGGETFVGDGDTGGRPDADTGGGSSGGTGGESTGGSGNSSTGGVASGGSSTGGSGTGGDLAPCEPPALSPGEGTGNDLNGLCGWNPTDNEPPPGYAYSYNLETPCEAVTETGWYPTLADDEGIWRTPFVSIVDPGDRCTEEPELLGSDRVYNTVGEYCMKVSSPFGFETEASYTHPGGTFSLGASSGQECVVYAITDQITPNANTEIQVQLQVLEEGWVQVDLAELRGDDSCPLVCD